MRFAILLLSTALLTAPAALASGSGNTFSTFLRALYADEKAELYSHEDLSAADEDVAIGNARYSVVAARSGEERQVVASVELPGGGQGEILRSLPRVSPATISYRPLNGEAPTSIFRIDKCRTNRKSRFFTACFAPSSSPDDRVIPSSWSSENFRCVGRASGTVCSKKDDEGSVVLEVIRDDPKAVHYKIIDTSEEIDEMIGVTMYLEMERERSVAQRAKEEGEKVRKGEERRGRREGRKARKGQENEWADAFGGR